MYEYVYDAELVRLALAFGVVASMLFYDRYGVTTGGIIVPGYLALFVVRPTHILATLLIGLLIYWMVQKLLRPKWMLWGRKLFETEIVLALILQSIWLGALLYLAPREQSLTFLYSIGFLLPGILAHDMGRQGARTTILASLGSALVVFGLITLVGAFRDIWGLPILTANELPTAPVAPLAFPETWLLVAIIASVVASIALYRWGLFPRALLTDSLRTGGFVTAGYLALFVTRPADLAFVLICSTVTYVTVTRILMKQAILFGRTKMATMFLTGIVVTWLAELLISFSGLDYVPWIGFNAIVPTIAALLANDAERQGPWRTLAGAAVATVFVLAIVTLIYFVYTWIVTGTPELILAR